MRKEKRTYGQWAGNPKGTSEDSNRCVQSVISAWDQSCGYFSQQCSRKRGHGPDGEYCKQHAKMIAERGE